MKVFVYPVNVQVNPVFSAQFFGEICAALFAFIRPFYDARYPCRDRDPAGAVLFIMISFSLKSWLNESDLKVYIDTLTGCFNRRILDIIKRRDLSHCSVVLLDCNKFKTVNDTVTRQAIVRCKLSPTGCYQTPAPATIL